MIKKIAIALMFIFVVACGGGNTATSTAAAGTDTDTGTDTSNTAASCDSLDQAVFCYSVNGGSSKMYFGDDIYQSSTILQQIAGQYNTVKDLTTISLIADNSQVSLHIEGSGIKTYVPGNNNNYVFGYAESIAAPNISKACSGSDCSGSVTISRYGIADIFESSTYTRGGYISGIFNVSICDVNPCTIVSGKFNVPRRLDVNVI